VRSSFFPLITGASLFDGTAEVYLEYELPAPGVYDLLHTVTPTAHRGQGLAERVAVAALEHIKAEGGRAILTCGYLATTFIERHPEYRPLLLDSAPMCKI